MANNYTDLLVYQKAFDLQQDIFELTKSFPKEEKLSLTPKDGVTNTAYCKLPTAYCKLQTANRKPQTAYYKLQTDLLKKYEIPNHSH